MKRPDFVTDEDVARWSENVENDGNIPSEIKDNPIIREVCYAGLYLAEELVKLGCPDDLIVRIQYTAGKLSFGRDIWETHQFVLQSYINNEIQIEPEPSNMN